MSEDVLPRVALWEPNPAGGWRWLDDLQYSKLEAERRFLSPGEWSLSGQFNPRILTGRLVTVDFRGHRFLTGTTEPNPSRTADTGRLSGDVGGTGALSSLDKVTIWPDPANPISQQGSSSGYYTIAASPAEDVVRQLVLDHYKTRYGADVVIPTSQHRGTNVRIHNHMGDLLEVATRKAKRGGIGFELGLVDNTGTRADLTLSFFVPTVLSAWSRLADGDGTLRSWSQTSTPPTCNRAIVWGAGDIYRIVEDTASINEWNRAYEQFVEAQDTFDPDTMDERGEEAIDQGAATSTFQLEAAESDGMRWGQHYDVGDQVLVELADSVIVTDTIGAVTLSVDTDSGVKVSPVVGDADGTDPEMAQAKLISALGAASRKQETRRSS